MTMQVPAGHVVRLDPHTGAPTLIKVERGQERPGISMADALAEKELLEQRASEGHQEASQWLRRLSDRQALLELHLRLRALEKRLDDNA